jgi:outer membrane receptor for ferrienterochelin and colicins
VSAFRNNVNDLIETLPVAVKPNGQNIFTYVNLNRIYTQGLLLDASLRPFRPLTLRAGYQYLAAKDRDVLDGIDAGSYFTRENGVDRRLTRKEYGGLFNRSRHMLTTSATYVRPKSGLSIAIRGLYRGRYGFGDVNGNLILDADREYVPGYWLWHVTFVRPVGDLFRFRAGVKNIFDHTDRALVPSLPGRQFFAGMSVDITP